MCALRNNQSVSAVTLACQYRLSQQPRRPPMRKVIRPRKGGPSAKENDTNETDAADRDNEENMQGRSRMMSLELEEEFDFDAEDDLDIPNDGLELSQTYYLQACKDLKVKPFRNILEGLVQEKMQCKGCVLLPNDVKACTIALLGSSNCERINFDGNEIGEQASIYWGDVFTRNFYLTEIRITWNALGTVGAEAICRALLKNNNVRILDLTGNQFSEDAAKYFKELLSENSAMYELYLGHNYFREDGGRLLADGIAQNEFLRKLDLSWNHLRMRGAEAIGRAIAKNINLEILDVSWNGLYIQGASHLALALTKNKALLDLDISCNRLSEACIAQFLKGMEKNSTLKKIRLSRNHITHTGVIKILQHMEAHPNIAINYIDLGDQHVHDDFVQMLEEIQQKRRLDVKYGMVWSREREPIGKHDQTEDELALLNENPHYVLMEFMRLQKLRLVDLFHQMDTDKSKGISVQEFQEGLKAVDIPLKRTTLEKFVRMCDTDRNGEIDFGELIEASKAYKEEVRRLAKTKTPLENTDIGRIQKLLRKIMLDNRGKPTNISYFEGVDTQMDL